MSSPRDIMFFGDDAKWNKSASFNATPLPKSLIRSKKVPPTFENTDHALVRKLTDDTAPMTDDDEETQKFSSFADQWAKQDADDNFKCDLLDDLEDTMEAVMAVADKVVKLTGKIKRSLRASKK